MTYSAAIRPHSLTADPDHAALRAAAAHGVALCTIVGIEGSFSRRRGAQIAVLPCGAVIGDLADTCLERELAAAALAARAGGPRVARYGKGSPVIDFRLPCGGGLDILIDPAPDRAAIRGAVAALDARREAAIPLAPNPFLRERKYIPPLAISAFGEGPELEWLARLAAAAEIALDPVGKGALALGQPAPPLCADRWTAVLLLFHDHEWERPLLAQALGSEAFFIGAQGGAKAREDRVAMLSRSGFSADQIARVRSPVGSASSSRTPQALALAALNDIVARYEGLHPHG